MIEYINSEQYIDLLDIITPIFYFLLGIGALFVIYVYIKLEKSTDFTIIHHNFQKNVKGVQNEKLYNPKHKRGT